MLIKADASQLEWRAKLFLAQDQVGIREILEGEDVHLNNQKSFGLPSRLISKVFVYRMIFADAFGDNGFGSPAYAYAQDPDFMTTSSSAKFWEKVIHRFFSKYQGIYEHSLNCIRTAVTEGRITIPTGRFYDFSQVVKYNGRMDWPRATILNYPVQGFSADIMKMVRLLIWHRLPKLGYGRKALLINTVHDDVELDVDNNPEMVYNISVMLEKCFKDVDKMLKRRYDIDLNVPMAGEVKFGRILLESNMVKFNPNTFNDDWRQVNAV